MATRTLKLRFFRTPIRLSQVWTFLLAVSALPLLAQNYAIVSTTGTEDPYEYTQPGATVLAVTSLDVLSSVQSLPFPWSFYGAAVSQYKVSDNGYLTFDSGAGTSYPGNLAIPNVAAPNHAIYAFWDALGLVSGSGSVDEVKSWTYGETGNRVHVVQWHSVTPDSGTGFVYAAVRFYECGDFDIVLNFGNATGMSATIGAENSTGTTGVQVAGSPGIPYPTLGSDGNDDVVYTFYWDGIQYDMTVTTLDIATPFQLGSQQISGQLMNLGSQAVTSYTLNYQVDAEPIQSMSVVNVNVPALGGSDSFVHDSPWEANVGGVEHDLRVWISNPNGSPDERMCNDEQTQSGVVVLGSYTERKTLLEMFTGAWCGWCPDGAVVLDGIVTEHGDRVIPVEIHDGDAMEFAEGIRSEFAVSAYPNGMVDRTLFAGEPKEPHSRGAWANNVSTRLAAGGSPAEVSVSSAWDFVTRTITATVQADFADYAVPGLKLGCMVIENTVVGSGAGYDQANYLNTTPGHPYEGAGDPIFGYQHRWVLRHVPLGALGTATPFVSTPQPGDTFTADCNVQLPAEYDEAQVSIVGFLARDGVSTGEREILDAEWAPLGQMSAPPTRVFEDRYEVGDTRAWSASKP